MSHENAPLRPRDLALLLLSAGDVLPRQRARDQQADRVGLEMKRQILARLAALDPEPADLEGALLGISAELGGPAGPVRAVAGLIRDEWRMACAAPAWVAQLLAEATEGRRHG